MKRKSLITMAILAVAIVGLGAGAALAMATSSPASAPESVPAIHDASPSSEAGLVAELGAAVEDEGENQADENEASDDESPDDRDIPIVGPDLAKASAVALEFTNGGRVTETEIEDEESYYEVEVTLDDGRQIDVQLDEEFNVVGTD